MSDFVTGWRKKKSEPKIPGPFICSPEMLQAIQEWWRDNVRNDKDNHIQLGEEEE